ncbi:DNA recombination protein RmuC [Pseudoclavibacter chungangensis]|uniref:DNA recombination protein RmuC n=1 Tax=Pseudoclavibacter chungangensis TaxID=587635 RepID=A0A7J5C0I3_9MICO|nr:DNA recombination protein RmuC [Pseudoclavibacter chungangensis]KAB1659664.1 DNA recombination protein RmuC [Pseudoclavibacter chungangensis]NYJ67502.1 DNA recombination protein RmuC [Pseudoclavibacter chungangensis]
METLIVVLLVVDLLLTIGAIVLLVLRRPWAGTGAGAAENGETIAAIRQANGDMRQEFALQRGELGQRLERTAAVQAEELRGEREARGVQLAALRDGIVRTLSELVEQQHASTQGALLAQEQLKATVGERFEVLRVENERKLEQVRVTLREELDRLRTGNEAGLEKMRETVDEKLQGTLEKRLGESFALVSERLEQVQKGLGEMQSLASDVGGLKRVLTNVKSRGTWGEVQLSRQLEDLLTPEQYERNVVIRPGTGESVEFAVKLPGREEAGDAVYLPIDAKFPQEDYERLLQAQEAGERVDVEQASRALERAVVQQAKTIAGKYIAPPRSTDFAIMYLPTEGLFAEVVRRPGLASRMQTEHRVLVTGPTTLMSLLNSLQMGFRTVAIEQRSSEVWQVLSAAKLEFQKYGRVWEKLEKQLTTAQNTVTEAGRRTRAVERKLRQVETTQLESELPVSLELLAEDDAQD